MKTILAIWNTAEKGKSSTTLDLANLLLSRFPTHKLIFSSKNITSLSVDFRLIIEVSGKTIALESQGDPKTDLEKRLNDIVSEYEPDIIVCTCRTRGETVQAIDNVARANIYDVIWTSTYQVTRSHAIANQAKAEHLLDLLTRLGLI